MATTTNNSGVCIKCGRHRYVLNKDWLCNQCENGNTNELNSKETFQLYLDGYSIEYFTYGSWWDLTESTPISVIKKCNQWKLK